MDNKQISKEWFEFARRDLESAKFLINMYPKPIEVRYPYQLEVTEDDMKNVIDSAEKVQKFIEDKL